MGERRILTTLGATLICCAGCGDEGQVGVLQQAGTSQAYFQVAWLPKHTVCKKTVAGELSCIGADDSQPITPQSVSGAAKVTQTTDKVDPRLQVEVELPLEDGRAFRLELDLPAGAAAGAAGAAGPPRVGYSESDPGGTQLFKAAGAAGRLQRMRPGCSCRDLVLDLLVIDGGPDQIVGTADDEHRHLRLGQLDLGSACLAPKLFAVTPATKLSLELLSCGDAGSPTGPNPGGGSGGGGDGSTYTPPSGGGSGGGPGIRLPDPPPGGCECEGSGDYGYDDSSDGCEGDTSSSDGCEGDTSSGGCEGDTGGCEGDTGGGGCEGDMGGADCGGDIGGGADCGGGGSANCRLAGGRRLRINTLPVLLLLLLGIYGVGRLRRRR